MGLKGIITGLTLLSGMALSSGGVPEKQKEFDAIYPKLVETYKNRIETVTIPASSCDMPYFRVGYTLSNGEASFTKAIDNGDMVDGIVNHLEVACTDDEVGDKLMPIASAQKVRIDIAGKAIEFQHKAVSYELDGEVEVVLQQHHSGLPFQKLKVLSKAYKELAALDPDLRLKRLTVVPMGDTLAYSEEGPNPDELIMSEEALREFSNEELHILLRHEAFHIAMTHKALGNIHAIFRQRLNSLSADEIARFEHKVNETRYFGSIFSSDHQRADVPLNPAERPTEQFVRFLNTYAMDVWKGGSFEKAALDALEQLLIDVKQSV